MLQTRFLHLPPDRDVLTEFPTWVSRHCDSTSLVLEIGAGQGKNSNPSIIGHMLEQTGFREVEFRYFDQASRFEAYFPKLLRWFPSFYSRCVYELRLVQSMGYIMFKATA